MEGPRFFPPESVAEIKAIACQLPVAREIPLSRFSLAEMLQEIRSELTLSISKSTLFRILKQDAIRPGFTDPGSLSRIRAFWNERVQFWICIEDIMRACHWGPKTTSSARTRNPNSKSWSGSSRLHLRDRADLFTVSQTTSATGPWPTLPHSISEPEGSLVVWIKQPASIHFRLWSTS